MSAPARQLPLPLPEVAPAATPPLAPPAGGLVLTRLPDHMPAGLLAPRLPPLRQKPLLPLDLPPPGFPHIREKLAQLLAVVLLVGLLVAAASAFG